MIQTGLESKIKIQQILDNQLPEFVLNESPNTSDFLKQYYISQEYQGGPVDISDNLSQYLKLDNLTPNVVVDSANTVGITTVGAEIINVTSTKGFPNQYGLLKIDDEIITYTGITTDSFTGCKRGFSGITSYHKELDQGELVFSDTTATLHPNNSTIQNLSSLFLKEFYKKQKFTLTPDLEDVPFSSDVNIGNFIKEASTLYKSKGTDESFRILFNVLYGETPNIINLEDYLLKPSYANYIRRKIIIADVLSGDPKQLIGQTIFKESDLNTNASISEVEPFTRVGIALTDSKQYWKISLFLGYDDSESTIQGNFNITPSSRCLDTVSIGSSVISVDSTLGFSDSGTLVAGANTAITYTNKSINQFFGCTGIESEIPSTTDVRNSDIYFGYENNDITKKVEMRLTGVLSKFNQISKNIDIDVDQIISVNGLGDNIEQKLLPTGADDYDNMSYKEIFANSWIYNTSVRYELEDIDPNIFNGFSIQTKNKIYKPTLKVGDLIEIVKRNSDEIVLGDVSDVTVENIDRINGNIDISQSFSLTANTQYDIRRKINYAKSDKIPLEYDKIISDVQNLYTDENDNSSYVASNSLPSGARDNVTNLVNTLNVGIQTAVGVRLSGFNDKNDKYSVIEFDTPVPFINGDEVFYKPISPAQNYAGLDTGNYYVGIVEGTDKKNIKLYASRSFIGDDTYWEFGNISQKDEGNVHEFILSSQKVDIIGPQKVFKKFSLESSTNRGTQVETEVGTVGMLINGVEISNYKSSDKIYYGPLDSVDVFNGGSDYDVINPPKIEVSAGLGITALIQPVLSGTITKVDVDIPKFSILQALSVDVTGGNGSASLEVSTVARSRLISFDGRTTKNGGGINTTTNQITFLEDHNLKNAQELIYKSYGNDNITVGIGTSTLVSNVSYYANVIDNKTIQLYNSKVEALASIDGVGAPISGINTIVFGSSPNYYGVHDFATIPKDTLLIDGVKVIDGGKFTNRKLIVKPIGISTIYDTITFKNHGFNDGEIVEYSTTGTKITGLTTSTGISTSAQQYQILKIDDDSFRLANAGIAGTITSNYISKDYVSLESIGTGYHNFAYPNISVTLKYVPVGFGTTTQSVESVVVTPTIKGSIVDSYLYETGTGYGSSILNFEKKPLISIKNGTGSSMKPIIINGKVIDVNIGFNGKDYYSIPDLNVIDPTGKGTGAELRPVIENNKVVDVKIIQSGIGYSATDTYINVVSRGKNGLINPHIRSLTFDISKKYKTDQLLIEGENKLSYTISGYNEEYRNSFGEITDPVVEASKIIGWAYDGNPIYGSYGYGDPQDTSSLAREMVSGYVLDASNVVDRPLLTDFAEGSFVDDYIFTNSGDLDRNNGRFGKTPEFPNGIYAYFATIGNKDGALVPQFPYFVGNSYRSVPIQQDFNQSFDFSSSDLLRNTFPYQLATKNVDNDFVIESHEISNQKAIVESVKSGPITNLEVISAGDDYKINDSLIFDNTNTGGFGLQSKISSLTGKNIVNVSTSKSNYEDVIFTWDNDRVKINILPHHNWESGDNIVISGFSTELSVLNGSHVIGFTTSKSNLIQPLISSPAVGVGTEISVSSIPNNISIGSSLKIGTETLKLLDIYRSQNILRVQRGSIGVSHAASSLISFLPDSFNINKSISQFDSLVNDKVYFNPKESIGFGNISGITSTMTFEFANRNITVEVLTQRIYLPNHPFQQDQKIIFDDTGTAVSISTGSDSALFNMPSTVYVSNTSDNTIGIRTGIGTNYSDVYFRFGGSDSDLYSFTSDLPQIKGKVERINTLVSLSTSHNLKHNDNVTLNIEPNLSVGIGTSTSILVKRQENTNYLLLNPIGFNSTGINTDRNEISFGTISHGLKTGDKIAYSADLFPEGISSKSYYVYKVNDNTIKLTQTLVDANNNPPTIIGIGSTGGLTQSISQINPSLPVIKSNNLVFDLTDSSLENYKFKLYYDNEFKNEFVSTGSTTTNNIIGVGTIGVSTNASLTLNYNTSLPDKLYYNLEKSGFINTADINVQNYSEIRFDSSKYNSSYNIIDVSDTTFTVPLIQTPEKDTYNSSECSILSYTTKSLTAKGGIDRVSIVDRGNNYSKLPSFVGSSSTEGNGAYVVSKSLDIGSANNVRIINEGFEYSSDVTLKPSAYISPLITIENSDTIGIISVTSGGQDYIYAPFIDIVDSITREKIQTPGILQVELSDNAIQNIITLIPPSGMPNTGVELFATNNSNGVAISSVMSNSTGIFTCWINTPKATEDSPAGFEIPPFAQTDEVYIEGITKVGTAGSGFNSSEFGYKFGNVIEYAKAGTMAIPFPNASTNDRVTIDLTGISTNTGIAVTDQQLLSILINKKNYPTFSVTQKPSLFKIGEKLITNNIVRDLVISHSEDDYIKVSGTYRLSINEIIIGKDSGTTATISNINENFGRYDVDSMVEKRIGWSNNIGELNLDTQVLPDNNYYQNLSYSVQSSKTFDELRSPVTSLLHTSGLKNFADVGITSSSVLSIGNTSVFSTIQDFVSNVNVETINNFDFAYDLGDFTSNVSSSIELKNKVLQAYNLAKSNQVLLIDSIKNQFSNLDAEPNGYLKLFKLTPDLEFKNLLVRISNLTNSRIQVNNLVILSNGTTNTLLNKNDFDSEIDIGEFDLLKDVFGDSYLRFTPKPDAFNYDYDLKTIETEFNSDISGIGTQNIGFVDITGTVGLSTVDINVGITTTKVIGVDSSKYKSFYVQNQLINQTTNEMNYVELYVTHDETDTYISEYFTDTHGDRDGYSDTLMGSFKGDLTGSEFSLQFENTSADEIKFKSDIVGFGTTSVGVGTYRFAASGQPAGSERSLIYDTQYSTGIGTTTLYSVNKDLFNTCNSLIEVSIGSTKALHQVTTIHTGTNVYTQLGPILSLPDSLPNPSSGIGTNTGIGTFGAYYDGSNFALDFYPDNEFISTEIQVSSFNTLFYTEVDYINTQYITDLTYGKCTDSANVYAFNALNGERINKKNFTLTSGGTPIFAKSFNPSDSSILDLSTGKFNIRNHFFRTNEELIYTPKSTYVGVGSTPMQYKPASGNIDILPSTVFAIRNDTDSFYISTTKSGTAVTFTSIGEGNAHEFAMSKSDTKAIISVNNIIQSPLSFIPISHTLQNNIDDSNTGISTTRTTFSLSGISTIDSNDILKIDNEYMKIVNVGLGTTTVGPITGIGTRNLVEVERSFVGSYATNHTNSTVANLYRGSYRIDGKEIHFTDAPRGNPQEIKTPSNLNYPSADFNGRVYLRSNYDTNQVYDDVSYEFTGVGQTFRLTVGGANTVGLGSTGGNGLLLINSIYQRPSANNNPVNNYEISENLVSGISSITFTGITTNPNSPITIDESSVNQNELPRGGLIVSLGSTPGRGYALAEGARVYLEKDSDGVINKIVGIATTGTSNPITTSFYNNQTGILEVITQNQHNFESGIIQQVKLVGLEFTCGSTFNVYDANYDYSTGDLELTIGEHYLQVGQNVGIETSSLSFICSYGGGGVGTYPRLTDPIAGISTPVTSITNNTITIGVGTPVDGTVGIHTYVGSGYDGTTSYLTSLGVATDAVIVKSGYSGITTYFFPSNSNVGLGSTSIEYTILDTSPGYYDHKLVSVAPNAVKQGATNLTPNTATYNAATGVLTFTFNNPHGIVDGSLVQLVNNSFTFTCSRDQYKTEHTYPRATDPAAYGNNMSVTLINSTSFSINVGTSQTQNRFTTNVGINSIPHTYVGGGFVMPWYGDATYGSGYYGNVSVAVTDIPYAHKFVSGLSTTLYKTNWAGTAYTATYASYNPSSGDLILEIPSHGMTTSDDVGIRTGSLIFTCSKDDYQSLHPYPRATDPVAGIITDITSYTTDTITVNVGASVGSGAVVNATVGSGGVLGLSIGSGGTSYNNPQLTIPEASYDNLSVTGVSRLSVGNTTDTGVGLLLNVEVGTSSTVGIASTYFEVTKWEIAREGYAFNKGDVFTPVGLVTDANLSSPQSQFQLTVLDTYRDAFSAWQFGQMDYIDSIKSLQDGERKRFPLRYDNELLSFEAEENGDFPTINLTNALLIIINGVLQDPNDAYIFNGGTSFIFTEPPQPEDDVAIFFYRGTAGEDSVTVSDVFPTLKRGDTVQLNKIPNNMIDQDNRTMTDIDTVNTIDTVLYRGLGITDEEKTLNWTKQKHDKIVNGNIVSKSRLSLESLIYPTTKIIGKLTESDNTIFVSDAKFFEEDGLASSEPIGGLIVDNDITPVAASITANVSSAGTISSLTIVNGGIGYTAAPSISIGIPSTGISVGIGTTATATTTISAAGTVNSASIVNPGLGYTSTNSPQVLVLPPLPITETITNINSISGFSGIITGISTTIVGVSTLGVSFFLSKTGNDWTDFNVGNPVYISNTTIGSGATSIDNTGSDNAVVGIGTTFLDNIYIIQYKDSTLNTGIITCLVSSGTVGIATSTGTKPLGEFSWGKFAGIVRDSNPIAIAVTGKTINSGLTTFPTIQRRGVGIRNTGALDEYHS